MKFVRLLIPLYIFISATCAPADVVDRATTDSFRHLPHQIQVKYPNLPPRPDPDGTAEKVAEAWLTALREAWLQEQDPALRETLKQLLWDDARDNYLNQFQRDVIADQAFVDAEITDDSPTKSITLKSIAILPEFKQKVSWWHSDRYREVGSAHVEAWTSSTGYLFTVKGRLVKKAQIKRVDGRGREWYGAFISDGSYCTTDIWDHDRQIHLFSKTDRWFKSIPTSCTVAWARASANGNAWIVRAFSSAMCDEKYLRVDAKGVVKDLTDPLGDFVAWRSIGPIRRAFWIETFLPSDDNSHYMKRHSPGHGPGSIYGTFELYEVSNWAGEVPSAENEGHEFKWNTVIPEGSTSFGFFPGSLAWWVGSSGFTWIMKPDGTALGWVAGLPLGDANPGEGILFAAADHTVMAVTEDGLIKNKRNFLMGKEVARPRWLKDDAKVGFFEIDGQVHFASW